MPIPTPPQLEAARAQLASMLEKLEGRAVDLNKEEWSAIEKSVVKALGGAFSIQKQEHQVIALGLAAAFADRLAEAHKVFWFPSRETAEGAELGFAEALVKLSPFGAVIDALSAAKLGKLDDVAKEIRTSLAQVKFGASTSAGAGATRLAPEDYMRLFDAGFVQLLALDTAKAQATWNTAPQRLSIDVRDALSRASKLPPEVKKQLEQQLTSALGQLEPNKPVIAQVTRAPRIVELMGLLSGTAASTGSAPEEFWMDVALPLLMIGQPASFPPLDEEELGVAKQGVDPLFLFLDVVPHQFNAPDEAGLLGVFAGNELALPDPGFGSISTLRLIKVNATPLKAALAQFDAAKTKDALRRFGQYVNEKTGPVKPQGENEAKQMLDAALLLLTDLKKVVDSGKDVCVRRLTEAEAASEPALAMVRQAMQGPRIILTS